MALFSFEIFIIALRESIEAALIVSILLAYLSRSGLQKYKKDVWVGTVVAIVLSFLSGVLLFEVFANMDEGLIEIMEGVLMLVAAVFVSGIVIWMYRNGKYMKADLEMQAEKALSEGKRIALILVPFTSVLREGLETVFFVIAVQLQNDLSIGAIFTSLAAGLLVSIVLGVVIFGNVGRINLKMFFDITSALLFVFAVFLVRTGLHEFEEAGVFGSETLGAVVQYGGLALYLILAYVYYRKLSQEPVREPVAAVA